jgi:hypothetical protein
MGMSLHRGCLDNLEGSLTRDLRDRYKKALKMEPLFPWELCDRRAPSLRTLRDMSTKALKTQYESHSES